MLNENFNDTLRKASDILLAWSKRSLVLLGKILVINTLIVPLFTHRLMIVCTPQKMHFNNFRHLILRFLWEGKKPKIAYEKLIRSVDQGGLNLVDLELKDSALKTKWVQVCKYKAQTTMNELLKTLPIDPKLIWDCNLSAKDIRRIFKPGMVTDILLAWSKIHYRKPISSTDVMRQCLWFNSNIKNPSGKTLLIKMWAKIGLNFVNQIIDDNGLKPCSSLIAEFGRKINILDYAAVVKAIPKAWLKTIKFKIETDSRKYGSDLVQESLKCSATVYKYFRDFKGK